MSNTQLNYVSLRKPNHRVTNLCLQFDNGFNISTQLYTGSDKTELLKSLHGLINVVKTSRQLDYPTHKEYEEAMLAEQPTNKGNQ